MTVTYNLRQLAIANTLSISYSYVKIAAKPNSLNKMIAHNRGVRRGGSKGSDKPPFKPGFFKKIGKQLASILNVFKYNSLHRFNAVDNPCPHTSSAKSSTTKIIMHQIYQK